MMKTLIFLSKNILKYPLEIQFFPGGGAPRDFFLMRQWIWGKFSLKRRGYKRGFNKRHQFFKNFSVSKLILKKGRGLLFSYFFEIQNFSLTPRCRTPKVSKVGAFSQWTYTERLLLESVWFVVFGRFCEISLKTS